MGNTPSGMAHMGTQTGGNQQGMFTPSDGFFLINAARSGDVEVLRLFLTKNPALAWAVSEQDKSTPWHSAAAEGHLHALSILGDVSKQGAVSNTFNPTTKAVNQVDSKGRTPLMLACKAGHYSCAQLLLQLRASWSAMDLDGQTALHYAALASHGGCVLLLLKEMGLYGDHGPEPPEDARLLTFVNAGDVLYGRTPLHLAAWSGQADGLHALLRTGANIMPQTIAGTTPLHLAAMMGHEHAAIIIVAAYVKAIKRQHTLSDPRQSVDAYGNTPFKLASSRHRSMPILLQVLNPNAIIVELQRWQKKQEQQQQKEQKQQPQQQKSPQKPVSEAGPSTPKKASQNRAGPAQDSPSKQASPDAAPIDPSSSSSSSSSEAPSAVVAPSADRQEGSQAALELIAAETKAAPESQTDALTSTEKLDNREITAIAVQTKDVKEPELENNPSAHGPGSPGSSAHTGSSASGTGDDADGDDSSDSGSDEEDEGTTTTEPTDQRSVSSAPATPDHTAPPRISIRRLKRLAAVSAIAHSALDTNTIAAALATGAPIPPIQAAIAARGAAIAGLSPAISSVTNLADGGEPSSNGKPQSKPGQVGRSALSSSDGTNKANAEPPPALRHKELSEKPVPDFYMCPLTCRIFKDPVVAADGYSYERVAIEKHLQRQQQEKTRLTSPSTRKPMSSNVVYTNLTLLSAVEFWKAQNNYCPEDMS